MRRGARQNYHQLAVYTLEGERWFGFSCVCELAGMQPEILRCRWSGTRSAIATWRCVARKGGCFTPATRLRELKRVHGREIWLFRAHDAKELEELSSVRLQAAPIISSPLTAPA